MGKKWKRLLVQRRRQQATSPTGGVPIVSNSEMIERVEAAVSAPEPEMTEDEAVHEVEMVEEAPVSETPKPKRRRSTRRKKTTSED